MKRPISVLEPPIVYIARDLIRSAPMLYRCLQYSKLGKSVNKRDVVEYFGGGDWNVSGEIASLVGLKKRKDLTFVTEEEARKRFPNAFTPENNV